MPTVLESVLAGMVLRAHQLMESALVPLDTVENDAVNVRNSIS